MTEQSKPFRWRSLYVCALAVIFVVIVFVEGDRQPGHRTPGELLQAVALGSQGVIQIVYGGIVIVFACFLALTLYDQPLHRAVFAARPFEVGLVCIVLAGVALIVSGCLASAPYPGGADASWPLGYWMHLGAGAVVTVLVPVTLLWFAYRLHEDPEVSDVVSTWTLVAAIMAAGIAVALFVFPPHVLAGPVPMMTFVARRSHLLVLLLWTVVVVGWGVRGKAEPAVKKLDATAAPHAERPEGLNWEVFAAKVEVLTLPLVLIGGVIALLEYSDSHKRDIREVSERAYEKADSNWTEFLKVCAEYPETDCYDGAAGAPSAVVDRRRQGVVLGLLIDTFEVAYVNYNNSEYANNATDDYCKQWPTWMVAFRRYARRDGFVRTWREVGAEYDTSFQGCMNAVIEEQSRLTPGELDDPKRLFSPPPDRCRLDVCSATSWAAQ